MHSWSAVEGCNLLKVVSRVKAFSMYLHTWSESVQPLALFRQHCGLWLWLSREGSLPLKKLPADLNPAEGTFFWSLPLLPIQDIGCRWAVPGSCIPSTYRAHTISQRCPWELQTSSHCTVTACSQVPAARVLPLSSWSIICCWESLDAASFQTKSIRRGLCQPAAAQYLKGKTEFLTSGNWDAGSRFIDRNGLYSSPSCTENTLWD